MLAGLFGFGAGLGLPAIYLLYNWLRKPSPPNHLQGKDWLWFSAATLVGGVTGPVLLMFGISNSPASSAALLLSLEGVFTALVAWFIFRERFDWRLAWGVAIIIAGSIVLSSASSSELGVSWGSLGVVGACLCWAIDNNLTRQISHRDPLEIASVKSFIAGGANLAIALAAGESLPSFPILLATGVIGVLNYGVTLVLIVLALRHIGASRTGAYFSITPFVGAAIAIITLGETITPQLLVAGGFMASGVWLCLPVNASRHK